MARFYVSAQGNRGEATRMGTKDSGIESHPRGWSAGVRVFGYVTPEGEDRFSIFATGGSGGGTADKLIGFVDDRGEFVPA